MEFTSFETFVKIEEGLFKTYPLDNLYSYLMKFLSASKIEIEKLRPDEGRNTINMSLSTKNITALTLSALTKLVDVRGYYVAGTVIVNSPDEIRSAKTIKYFDPKEVFDAMQGFKLIHFLIEAKFDKEIPKENLPDYLFHVTPLKYVDKITKRGLIPRHQDKLSYHPERIYFCGNPRACADLAEQFSNISGIPLIEYTILKIDIRNSDMIFRIDPNCIDMFGNVFGIYTQENIAPSNITVFANLDILIKEV